MRIGTALMLAALLAACQPPAAPPAATASPAATATTQAADRYEMVGGNDGSAYRLDKQTGEVRYYIRRQSWKAIDMDVVDPEPLTSDADPWTVFAPEGKGTP